MVPVAAATMTPVPLLGALVYYKFRHLWEKKDGEQVGSKFECRKLYSLTHIFRFPQN